MTKYPFFLLLFAIVLFVPEARSDKYYFKHSGIEKGLSQSSVLCILQDRTGFMWFGTKDGLNRYDGISFTAFRHETAATNELGNNVINSMHEDKDGMIWLGTDGGVYLYNPEQETFRLFEIKNREGAVVNKPVYYITGDDRNNIWFAVESQGMFCFERKKEALHHYPVRLKDGSAPDVVSFCFDHQNTIWLGLNGKGLYFTNNLFEDIHSFTDSGGKNAFENDIIYKIIPEDRNRLYIGSSREGFTLLNIINKEIKKLLPGRNEVFPVFVRNILKFSETKFWIGTENGIYIYDSESESYAHLKHDNDDPYSLSDNAIYSICKDREGGIWVGSYFGGVDYYPPDYTRFEKYYPLIRQNSISGKIIREFLPDSRGNIWIGTEDAGLNLFNPHTKTFTRFKNEELYHNIHALCEDDDKLWAGTFSGGLYVIDLNTHRLIKHYLKHEGEGSINNNNIFSMYKTSFGELYIGTPAGLNRYNRATDSFENIKELEGVFVFDILEDKNGYIWFASYTSGIFKYNPRSGSWKNYASDPDRPGSLPYDKVISIFYDSNNRLWFTMQGGGLCSFDPSTEVFTPHVSKDIRPYDVIYKIVEDNNRQFWLTTNKGLIRFDPESGQTRLYTTSNGLVSNQFNFRSGFKADDGQIYLGGINGFISFNPDTFRETETVAPVVITDFLLFNKQTGIGPGSPLKKSITFSDELRLKYNQNSFSFRFASLSYIAPEANYLLYQLEGFDKEWYAVSDNPTATYTNLKPGQYTFLVKNAQENGSVRKINIRIDPPFWKSVPAFLIYTLLTVLLIGFSVRRFRRRLIRKQKYRLDRLEAEKEKEIYRAKVDFFTNVAHEIRTPLTLIKGPLENVLKKNNIDTEIREDLHVMEKNTLRLLNLTNQLLDFRKTEVKGFRLNFVRCNISLLIRETYSRFYPTAKDNKLRFELNLPEKDLYAAVDKEALTKILSNLFTNAVKYSENYITVELQEKSKYNMEMFSIVVCNDGTPIPPEMREEIFKPFVRIENTSVRNPSTGTGIGLALAASLVELHKGRLFLEPGHEICFYLELPVEQEMVIQLAPENEPEEESIKEFRPVNTDTTTLLVVEDDPEMMDFIVKRLKESYSVLTASNGTEALRLLEKQPVNLIVSDVMMPETDGFELCRRLKSDLSHSHIPIILLTAKANLQSKIEGIELGADDYIEKPFSTAYLLARIKNLLTAQEKRNRAFSSSPFVEAKTIALSKTDETFLEKLTKSIHKNISDPNFNVDVLAEQMNMSRSNLHRKIKGLSQLTPNDFIQLERLKKAAQLIRSGDYRISEVCYIVGFSSSSYFAKCFQKRFGVLPKEFGKARSEPEI